MKNCGKGIKNMKKKIMKIGILRTDTVREELVEEFGEYPDMFEALLSAADPDLHQFGFL